MANTTHSDRDKPSARILGLLSQVQQALEQLAATGQRGSIDLRSQPLTRAEDEYVERLLGGGEVSAMPSAQGVSELWETELAGVWLVVHRDGSDHVLAKLIEVRAFPALLGARPEDARDAASRLQGRTAGAAAEPNVTAGEAT